jgi:hypothetical protein
MAKESTPSISEERIVPSSSQTSIKTTTTSTAATGWIDSTSFSNVSFDQLSSYASSYARRASNSSLSLLNVASVLPSLKSEDAEQKLVERIQKSKSSFAPFLLKDCLQMNSLCLLCFAM